MGKDKIYQRHELGLTWDSKVKANQVFMFYAYARSGHHAVIEWVCKQFSQPIRHLNFCDWNKDLLLGVKDSTTQFQEGEDINILTSNYENFDLDVFTQERCDERINNFVLGEPTVKHFVIVRDPYNHAASLVKRQGHICKNKNVYNPAIYAKYAEEVLGTANRLPNAIGINYNKWHLCKDYRQDLFDRIGGETYDDGHDYVPVWAGGSTFDNRGYQGKGSQMAVRERWKTLTQQEILNLRHFLFDDRVIELACKLHDSKFIMPIVDSLRKKL